VLQHTVTYCVTACGLTYHFSAQLRKLFQVLIMNPVAIYHFLLKVFSCIIFVVYDQMVISLGGGARAVVEKLVNP